MTKWPEEFSWIGTLKQHREINAAVDRQVDSYVAGDYTRDGLVCPCLDTVKQRVGAVFILMLNGRKTWFR